MVKTDTSKLLQQWEESYKKGLLSFWILFSLTQRSMYAYEMRKEINDISQGSISVEDNSIYRALKRFIEADLINFNMQSSPNGPDRKYFYLTSSGKDLLQQFIKRNILVIQSEKLINASHEFIISNE
jgi:DNA-binding PadR family transcriptional regulator